MDGKGGGINALRSLLRMFTCRDAGVGVLESGSSGYEFLMFEKTRQGTYNRTLRSFRVMIVAVEV